jgi:hypothetical protein
MTAAYQGIIFPSCEDRREQAGDFIAAREIT